MTAPVYDQMSDATGNNRTVFNMSQATQGPALAGGKRYTTSVGLTLELIGGNYIVAGVPTQMANSSLTLAASSTTYVYRNVDGTLTQTTTAPTNWPGPLLAGATAVCSALTSSVTITTFTDYRIASGQPGESGGAAVAIRYAFSTTTTDSDPGAGRLRLSNATQNTATVIRADLADDYGNTVTSVLDLMDDSTSSVTGLIRLRAVYDPTKWLLFSLASIASPSGYRNLSVTNVASSSASPFADGQLVWMEFTRTGDKGATGATGTAGFSYTYSTTTTASDPGSGTLRFNNATLASATALYISETDGLANNLAAEIATWDDSTSTIHAKLQVVKETDATKFSIFNITGTLTDNGTWDTLTVAHVVSGSALANGDAVKVIISRAGDKGDTGSQANNSRINYLLFGAFP